MAKPPLGLGTAAIWIAATICLTIVIIFAGFNFYHAKTLREEKAGQVDQRYAPKSPTDLQAPRNPERR